MEATQQVRADRGFSLVEAVLAIAVAGLLVLIAIPRTQLLVRQANLRGARSTVATLIQQSRMQAIRESRSTTVHFGGTRVWVTASPRRQPGVAPCQCDTLGAVSDLQALYGVTLSVAPDTFRLDPRGLGVPGAATLTLVLSFGGHTDSVTVDPLGKVAL